MFGINSVQFVVVVILSTQVILFCAGQKKGEKNVCILNKRRLAKSKEIYICCQGYKRNTEKNICVPKCDRPCINGTCTKPNECACNSGYQPDTSDKYLCIPECTPPCENGICTSPNVCTCSEGYTSEGNSSTCKPRCEGCEHGNCIKPNDCKCHKGYSKFDGVCKPICDFVCVNGICSEPNKCACNSGYEVDPGYSYNCLPKCEPKCVNAYCSSPNKCTCLLGYEKTGNDSVCEPKCHGCENGQCIAPNNCSCHEGFERIGLTCKPKCSSCSNGLCLAPEKCQCHEGYELSEEGCKPVCALPCVNGYCSAPNHCTCDQGYQKHVTDHNSCFKPCPAACYNGSCNLDSECECKAGFEFNNDTMQCTFVEPPDCNSCEVSCTDGNCWCPDGRTCIYPIDVPSEITNTKLAGLGLTWMVGAGVGLLLIILVMVVIQRMWQKRKDYPQQKDEAYGSVIYTVPHTLIQNKLPEEYENNEDADAEKATTDTLLRKQEEY